MPKGLPPKRGGGEFGEGDIEASNCIDALCYNLPIISAFLLYSPSSPSLQI